MNKKRINFAPLKNDIVIMDGGLNETVSSLELKSGELISCLNYQLTEGSDGGYVSIAGYERYDGQEAPSSIIATEEDHVDQDAARALIGEVPGINPIRGLHLFKGKLYAFRDKTGGLEAGMYVESPAGWVEIDTSANPITAGGEAYSFVNYNYFAGTSTLSMYWVDGVSKARGYDGTTVIVIDNAGMDPNDEPINIAAHDNRLFLAYEGGSLQYSALGDPSDWGLGAGEIGTGREITDLLVGVGNSLIVFCDENIKILQGVGVDNWTFETFSDVSGSFPFTAKRLLGTAFYMDDRGITSMEAVDSFGDYSANSISQRVKRTLLANKQFITQATVQRDLNQYRIFFDTGQGIYLSFLDKQLAGITLVDFPAAVLITAEGEDVYGDTAIFFGSEDGFVYHMDSGTSFDGESIPTLMTTSYYHYKSPRNWKRFKKLTFEIASIDRVEFAVKPDYDYSAPPSPKAISSSLLVDGFGSKWDEALWDSFTWSGSEITNRAGLYTEGIGSNMSVSIRTNETYKRQHTIQNMITDYTLMGRQV